MLKLLANFLNKLGLVKLYLIVSYADGVSKLKNGPPPSPGPVPAGPVPSPVPVAGPAPSPKKKKIGWKFFLTIFILIGILILAAITAALWFSGFSVFDLQVKAAQLVSNTSNTEGISLKWIILGLLLAFFGPPLIGLVVALVIYKKIREKTEKKKSATKPGDPPPTKKTWKEREIEFRDNVNWFRNYPLFFPVLVIVGWFLAISICWIVSDWLPIWDWLHSSERHKALTYFTPFVVSISVPFIRAKSWIVKTVGFLIWLPLAAAWIWAIILGVSPRFMDSNTESGGVSQKIVVPPPKPTYYELHWIKPPNMAGYLPKIREGRCEAVITRNDGIVFEFVAMWIDNQKTCRAEYTFNWAANPEMGKWKYLQDDPDGIRLHGEFYIKKDGNGGYVGGLNDQYTEGKWVTFTLKPVR